MSQNEGNEILRGAGDAGSDVRQELKLSLTVRRMQAEKFMNEARKAGKEETVKLQAAKIRSFDQVAEKQGWRFCEKCGAYEEYDDDKCKRCGTPLYRYSAKG